MSKKGLDIAFTAFRAEPRGGAHPIVVPISIQLPRAARRRNPSLAFPLLRRFAPRTGLVIPRQTFARHCQTSLNRYPASAFGDQGPGGRVRNFSRTQGRGAAAPRFCNPLSRNDFWPSCARPCASPNKSLPDKGYLARFSRGFRPENAISGQFWADLRGVRTTCGMGC